ncbi:uncharacterized protein LOC129585856 [Paramacrobiotus metropolitanus]|uniref:uncharacterized protein LOC129585856 n=1 Tax=Paramacrobiotus metropolitanus TaxID=2943436 RepID=UPI0024459E7D|nr:uncharacterized protein LOC129585856 [Paramacrobiotus metropolitanus]
MWSAVIVFCLCGALVQGRSSRTSTTASWRSTGPAVVVEGEPEIAGAAGCENGPAFITTQAIAVLGADDSDVSGTIQFDQAYGAGPVTISGAISGLTRGKHGVHIQEYGNIKDGCGNAGADYNPDNYHHGGPSDPERHAGDLGNINANARGTAVLNMRSSAFSLNGDYSVIGRAIVIYQNEDDYGRENSTESLDNGNVGEPIACGVIGIATQEINPQHNVNSNELRTQRDDASSAPTTTSRIRAPWPCTRGSENVEHEPHFGEHGQHRPGGPEEDQEWGNNAAPHRGFQPEAGFFPIGELSPDQLQELCNAAKDTVSKAAVSISGNSDRSGKISGSIEIVQNEGTGPITITGNISGLTPGQHGFKVYSYGNLKDGCNSGGKPFGVRQSNSSGGQSSDTKRYAGDLENIRADSSGAATFTLSDSVLSLNGDWSIIGRMLVISEEADNFGGYGQTNDAFDYSDSSKKIACGVVARVQETFTEINADDVAAVQVEDVKEEQVAAYEAALNGVEQPIYAFNFVTFAMLLVSIYVIQF